MVNDIPGNGQLGWLWTSLKYYALGFFFFFLVERWQEFFLHINDTNSKISRSGNKKKKKGNLKSVGISAKPPFC